MKKIKEFKEKIHETEWKEDEVLRTLIDYNKIVNTPISLTEINEIEGRKLNTAIDDEGNVITELINSKLNTQTKMILSDFKFGTYRAIKITNNDNDGVFISQNGILGRRAGATTFAIDINGNATFAGELVAAYGTLGTITSGNIIFQFYTSSVEIFRFSNYLI